MFKFYVFYIFFHTLFLNSYALFSLQDDLLSSPKWRISFQVNDGSDVADVDENASVNASYEHVKFNGENFLCSIPLIEPEKNLNEEEKINIKKQEQEEITRLKKSGLKLLEPLSGFCMYYEKGWWKYAYCHNNKALQFHSEGRYMTYEQIPDEVKNSNAFYVLGEQNYMKHQKQQNIKDANHDASIHSDGNQNSNQNGNNHNDDQDQDQDYDYDNENISVQSFDDTKHLVIKMKHGTICDLTNQPRNVEIHIYCDENSPERISWFNEVSTCEYILNIRTPKLCRDPGFLPKTLPSYEISCKRVISQYDTNTNSNTEKKLGKLFKEQKIRMPTNEDKENLIKSINHREQIFSATSRLAADITQKIHMGVFVAPDGSKITSDSTMEFKLTLADVHGNTAGNVLIMIQKGSVYILLGETRTPDEIMSKESRRRLIKKLSADVREDLKDFLIDDPSEFSSENEKSENNQVILEDNTNKNSIEDPSETQTETYIETYIETHTETQIETQYESPNESSNESSNENPDESPDEGLNESPNEGLNESPNEGLNESTNEGLNESPNEGLNESPDEELNESPNEGFNESPTEDSNGKTAENFKLLENDNPVADEKIENHSQQVLEENHRAISENSNENEKEKENTEN